MHPSFLTLVIGFFATSVAAAEVPSVSRGLSLEDPGSFQLGGSTEQAARVPTEEIIVPEPPRRTLQLGLPRAVYDATTITQDTIFGDATFYLGEGWEAGRDAYLMGTAVTRGQATAGISITVIEDERELSRSELYLDYALTDRFSVGVSGALDTTLSSSEATTPQFGLNAEFASDSGAYLQGGIADAEEADPTFGLSVGFRF